MKTDNNRLLLLLSLLIGSTGACSAVFAEVHFQCARTRTKLPARDYHKDDLVLSVTVVSPLTTAVTVDTILPIEVAATIPPLPQNQPVRSPSEAERLNDIIRLRRLISQLEVDPARASEQLVAERLLAGYLQRPEIPMGVRTAPGTGPKLVTSSQLETTSLRPSSRNRDARNHAIDCRLKAAEPVQILPVHVYRPAPVTTEFVRTSVSSKTFRIGTAVRLANGVIFDQPVLTVYETGVASVNGLVLHDGGPNQALLGSQVTIRVRALGDSGGRELAPAYGPLFWETSKTLRIARGKSERLKLTSEPSEEIRLHFSEIQRMEVNLESPLSR